MKPISKKPLKPASERPASKKSVRTPLSAMAKKIAAGEKAPKIAPTPMPHEIKLGDTVTGIEPGKTSTIVSVATGKRSRPATVSAPGALPTPPNFEAATHKPYRAKLAKLIELAAAGDVEGLAAVKINPTSTSPRALIRYRDAAIAAIQAKDA